MRQIDRQLDAYLKRVESVLGKGWENHIEGQQLRAEGDQFKQKLNPQPLFQQWVDRVHAQKSDFDYAKLFSVTGDSKGRLALNVNFDTDVIQLAKEVMFYDSYAFGHVSMFKVRHINAMGDSRLRVPMHVRNKAHKATTYYPFAVSLMDSVRTYTMINERIDAKAEVQ